MLSPDYVRCFDSIPEGRKACFEILDRRQIRVEAVVLKQEALSVFYMEGFAGAIQEITIHAPGKHERLASLFECIQQDKALIPVKLNDDASIIALPASNMQNNSIGLTANAILGVSNGRPADTVEQEQVMPAWLISQVGCDVTTDAMREAIAHAAAPRGSHPGL